MTPATGLISGTRKQAGDFKLQLKFRLEGDEATDDWQERTIPLIINPDPKSALEKYTERQGRRLLERRCCIGIGSIRR